MTALTGACTGPSTSPTVGPTSPTVGPASPVVGPTSPTAEPTAHPSVASRSTAGGATTPVPGPAAPSTDPASDEASRTGAPPTPCESEALIEQAGWIELDGRPSLEVEPTEALRRCGPHGASEQAWHDVLELIPDADTDGMREQFACHVLFAPTKDVWHLEPWRPVVDGPQLLTARCNPGGADPDLG